MENQTANERELARMMKEAEQKGDHGSEALMAMHLLRLFKFRGFSRPSFFHPPEPESSNHSRPLASIRGFKLHLQGHPVSFDVHVTAPRAHRIATKSLVLPTCGVKSAIIPKWSKLLQIYRLPRSISVLAWRSCYRGFT